MSTETAWETRVAMLNGYTSRYLVGSSWHGTAKITKTKRVDLKLTPHIEKAVIFELLGKCSVKKEEYI